jgi:hypothetical protein
MKTHSEQDLLSAFVDGELTEREQVTLEAHLASCADCRGVLDALRATLGDLASIPEAVPSQRDSWALRSAIAKERRLDRRGRRWYLISGGAAAALVAILAFALSTGTPGADGAGVRALGRGALSGPELMFNSTNYTGASARQVLLGFSSTSPDWLLLDQQAKLRAGGSGGTRGTETTGEFAITAGESTSEQHAPAYAADEEASLARCVDTVTGSTQKTMTPRYYEAASFDGRPAFLLIFEIPEAKRLELWVLLRDSCETKFWAQTQA